MAASVHQERRLEMLVRKDIEIVNAKVLGLFSHETSERRPRTIILMSLSMTSLSHLSLISLETCCKYRHILIMIIGYRTLASILKIVPHSPNKQSQNQYVTRTHTHAHARTNIHSAQINESCHSSQ